MEQKRKVQFKIREVYQKILPYSARMAVRRELMATVPLSKRQFENRVSNKIEVELSELAVWADIMKVEIGDLWELV